MRKVGLLGDVKVFYIGYNAIDNSDILDIHIFIEGNVMQNNVWNY